MSQDRREAIENAFGAMEEEEAAQSANPVAKEPASNTPSQDETLGEVAEKDPLATTPADPPSDKPLEGSVKEAAPAEKTPAVDKAPQSWRPAQKEKWGKLDPDVRQEVIRREREVERVLSDSAQARQLASSMNEAVAPYMARIQALGVSPVQAAQQLFRADHILSTATPAKRAEFMAKMISDYAVDIVELDRVLSGQQTQADPVQSAVERLLKERLAPLENFLGEQSRSAKQLKDQAAAKVTSDIEAMAVDPKFPHFAEVREDMADLIEIQAKRGVYLPLDQAYNRAIAMNPQLNQLATSQAKSEADKAAALKANARAQRALSASRSVGGAPNGSPSAVVGNDRRATIEAALNSVEGR